jgi:transposase
MSMRNVREILRLRYQLGLPGRQIASSLGYGHKTVQDYLARAEAGGLSWPLPEDMDDEMLEKRLFPHNERRSGRPQPDFAWMRRELSTDKNLTLGVLWKEYSRENPDGYQFSNYCALYREWLKTVDVCLRQVYFPGDKLFIDFAGDTRPVIDPVSGEIWEGHIFVAVLGYSNLIYAEAFRDETSASWVAGTCNSLEYYGGSPRILVPDNPKSVVTRPCRYEPEIHAAMNGLAAHYGMAVIPARPRKPRDKPKVEFGVGFVERQIMAPLRHRDFFSLGELNADVRKLLKELNERPFEKIEGARRLRFETEEKAKLRPLPSCRYELEDWRRPIVHPDYHVEIDHNFYSVPFQLKGQQLEARLTASTVEILYKGRRVASHVRLRGRGQFSTIPDHMPSKHQQYLEHNTLEWVTAQAESVGPSTLRLVQAIAERRQVPEQAIRTSLGILNLARKYGRERLEAACARALVFDALSYRQVKNILDKEMDRLPQGDAINIPVLPLHENLRGSAYYGGEN